jgi:hypothetical protein
MEFRVALNLHLWCWGIREDYNEWHRSLLRAEISESNAHRRQLYSTRLTHSSKIEVDAIPKRSIENYLQFPLLNMPDQCNILDPKQPKRQVPTSTSTNPNAVLPIPS